MLRALVQCSGGLALFLWGLQKIKSDFKSSLSSKVQKIVALLTFNFATAVLTGLFITMLMQSSSAAIIIIIALVNLNLLDFRQALGIIVGANIGTTVTVQLLSFDLANHLGFFFGAAFFFYLVDYFSSWRFSKYLAQGLIAFSAILLGLEFLSSSLYILKDSIFFIDLITYLSHHPLLALIVGLIVTAIVQSSSALTALVVALAKQNLITLEAAIALALGSNIGTCVTAFFASLGGRDGARLTAWSHLYFNLIGVLIFIPLLPYFVQGIEYFSSDLSRQIANAHTSFNLLTAGVIFLVRQQLIDFISRFHN